MQLQGFGGDVAQVVARRVIALIERLPGDAAITLRLLLGLDVLGAGEQPAEGDAVFEELCVVGAEVDLGAFRRRIAQLEVGAQQTLDGGRAGRPLQAEVGAIAVVDEVAVVRRTDHVDVQVGLDAPLLLIRQLRDVVGRANQPGLLGTPPGKTHFILRPGLTHQQCHFQQRGAAGPVVVDAGAFEHRIQMRADHDHVARVTAAGFGQQVVGLGLLAHHIDVHAQLQARSLRPGHAVVVGGEHHWNAAAVVLAQGRDQQPLAVLGVALIEDDCPRRTGRRGIGRLLPEWAGTTLHQRDGTGREPGEVLRFTTAGRRVAGTERQVNRHHWCGDVARVGLVGIGEVLLPNVLHRLRRHGAQRAGVDRIEG